MPRVFICYRRADSELVVGRIYDHLTRKFGAGNVIKDVNAFPAGSDFRHEIAAAVQSCNVILVVIGPGWLAAADENGARRLENRDDLVRTEAESGLTRKILVIPVLVGGAKMPAPRQLPPSLEELSFKGAIEVRPDPDFPQDMERLIQAVKRADHGRRG